MAHVIKTLQDNLSAETDPFYASFGTPPVLAKLIELGNLGQKAKKGFYKKVGRDILQFELDSEDYVPAGGKADEVYGRMLKKPAAERLKLLRNAEGRRAASCGPSCATASTTRPSTWRALPSPPATWTRPCAGASA